MSFKQKYLKILNIVQGEIEQVLDKMTEGVEVQEPLKSKLFKLLNAPSKHIRPLVSFLYLKAIGANIDEKQVLYQSAIELVHNASLIHDDVIDESTERRGEKTLNFDFGSKLAVISGDYLLAIALDRVLKLGEIKLIQMFSDTLEVMSSGEINQHFNKFKIPTIDQYIRKSAQKTAKLFETALCGSLLIAKNNEISTQTPFARNYNKNIIVITSEASQSHSRECNAEIFARNFGIAFQIRDDLINCKTTNSDIKEGVYNAPVIFSGGTQITSDAIEKTQTLLNNYIDTAVVCLADIPANEYKCALIELLELMRYE